MFFFTTFFVGNLFLNSIKFVHSHAPSLLSSIMYSFKLSATEQPWSCMSSNYLQGHHSGQWRSLVSRTINSFMKASHFVPIHAFVYFSDHTLFVLPFHASENPFLFSFCHPVSLSGTVPSTRQKKKDQWIDCWTKNSIHSSNWITGHNLCYVLHVRVLCICKQTFIMGMKTTCKNEFLNLCIY